MFQKWLLENDIRNFDFSGKILEKASNRKYWETQYKKEYIEKAEKYLGYEWPLIRATDYIAFNTEGDRLKQERPHFHKRAALIALTMGELSEYKGRFIPDIVDGIYNICEESFWGLSAHHCNYVHPKLPFNDHYIDLFAAETGALIATVIYLFYDELYEFWPEIVERAEYNLEQRIIKPYINHKDFWWMAYGQKKINNWNPWILSNLITVFLLTQQKSNVLYDAIQKMFVEINVFYSGYCDDGGCEEGMDYWCLSVARILDFCKCICKATNGKINFFDDKKITSMGDYPYKTYVGNNYYVNFADCGCKGSLLRNALFYECGGLIKNKNLRAMAKRNFSDNPAEVYITHIKDALSLFEFYKSPTEECDLTLLESGFFPILQNAFSREGSWYFAAKGGHNTEHHNHNDVGSFIVYHDLKPLLIDVGVGIYTKTTFSSERYKIWTMRSDWHNLPTINGKLQGFGHKFCADQFEYNDKKCKISFKNAYEDGTELKSLTREISASKNGISINDEFVFQTPTNTVCEHFVTPMTVEINDSGAIIGNKYLLSCDCNSDISAEKQEFFGDTKLYKSWDTDCIYRINFTVNSKDKLNINFTLREI